MLINAFFYFFIRHCYQGFTINQIINNYNKQDLTFKINGVKFIITNLYLMKKINKW